ncbi:DUF2064 domain-containing protein [Aquicoccus sp. SCR17]|nr:DUF2064 domain-containing protein [Carideicomes alvinocaridis]
MRPRLVLMLKEPRPGRVKTRLAAGIGRVEATWWFRHQVARSLRALRDPRWDLWLAVAPEAALASRAWPRDLPRLGQGRGDLGARMARVFRRLGPGPVCIVGSDIPGMGPAHVARAFAALKAHRAVLGPAEDGGYWLIGLRGTPPAGLFDNVRWSTPHALEDTRATLREPVALVDRLADVDEARDLPR